jgi:uncharacterized protein DUF1003
MTAEPTRAGGARSPELANVVERNIQALLAHRQPPLRLHSPDHPGSVGSDQPGMAGRIARFDPSFTILASVASVEALFLATFVLITQKRMALLEAKRAELDLQISLLGRSTGSPA